MFSIAWNSARLLPPAPCMKNAPQAGKRLFNKNPFRRVLAFHKLNRLESQTHTIRISPPHTQGYMQLQSCFCVCAQHCMKYTKIAAPSTVHEKRAPSRPPGFQQEPVQKRPCPSSIKKVQTNTIRVSFPPPPHTSLQAVTILLLCLCLALHEIQQGYCPQHRARTTRPKQGTGFSTSTRSEGSVPFIN